MQLNNRFKMPSTRSATCQSLGRLSVQLLCLRTMLMLHSK